MGRAAPPEILLRVTMSLKSEPDLQQEKRTSIAGAFWRRKSLLRMPFVHRSRMIVERPSCEANRLCNLRSIWKSHGDLPVITPERRSTSFRRPSHPHSGKTFRAKAREVASSFASWRLLRMQSTRSGALSMERRNDDQTSSISNCCPRRRLRQSE
jgi:hypothetical protein